jgi:hypothetical protein
MVYRMDSPEGRRWPLAAVFAVALAARLAVLGVGPWSDPGRALLPDSRRYVELAGNLRHYATFGLLEEEGGPPWRRTAGLRDANGTRPPRDARGLRPESFRTPGYPAFLALVGLISTDLRAVLIAQCLLGSVTACVMMGLARSIGITRPGSIAVGFLWALHPALLIHDNVILTEPFFDACIAAGLLVASRSKGPAGWIVAGGLIGLSALVRPLVGLLFVPSAIALAWPLSGRRLVTGLCIAVVAIGPTVGWTLRNRAMGEGTRVSSIGDLTLLYYAAAYAISEERGEDWFRAWPGRVDELADRLATRLVPGEDVYTASRTLAFEELARRPVVAAKVVAKSQVKLLVDHSLGDACAVFGREYRPSGLFARLVLGQQGDGDRSGPGMLVIAASWMLLNAAIAATAAVGLALAFGRRDILILVAFGLPAVLVAVVTSTNGLERFRLPMMPPLFLLAAYATTRGRPKPGASARVEQPPGQADDPE